MKFNSKGIVWESILSSHINKLILKTSKIKAPPSQSPDSTDKSPPSPVAKGEPAYGETPSDSLPVVTDWPVQISSW